MNKDKLCIYPLIISVILFILFMLIGMQKVGYHVDEMFTFSLSNQEYPYALGPQVESGNSYGGESFVNDNLTVSENMRFDYKNVFLNQSIDVHPPLYYMIIHTMCSLWPNSFENWMGLIPNVIMAVIAFWQFVVVFENFCDRKKALVFSIILTLSMGFINNVVFYRMYMLLTVWTNFLFILFFKVKPKDKKNIKFYLSFLGIIIGGLMTQYYFAIICMFSCLIYGIRLIYVREMKDLLKMIMTGMVGIGSSVFIFPSMIQHIFSGSRGTEAFENLATTDFGFNIKSFFQIINLQMFGTLLPYILMIIVVLWICAVLRFGVTSLEWGADIIQIGLPTVLYICLVAKIAPYQIDRYVMNVMGLLYITVFVFLLKLSEGLHSKAVNIIMLLAVCSVALSYQNGIPYLYLHKAEQIKLLDEIRDSSCIYIYNEAWKTIPDYMDIRMLNEVVFINNQEINCLDDEKYCSYDSLIVYLDESNNVEEIINKILENNPKLEEKKELYHYAYAKTFYLE